MTDTGQSEHGLQTPTQHQVAEIWTRVLGVAVSSRSAEFFRSGGDSFLATKAIVRIRAQWGVDVGVNLLLDNPTLQDLAARLDEMVPAPPNGTPQ
jgi:hypothetical protein